MRISAAAVFSVFLVSLAAFAVVSASSWSFKTALFPLATGIPLLILALAELMLELRGRGRATDGPPVDLAPSADVPEDIARRRALSIFAWMGAFAALVFLVGFALAVPLFMFPYLMTQSSVGFWRSLALTAAAWGFFHGLFERVLHLPFASGVIQPWLGL